MTTPINVAQKVEFEFKQTFPSVIKSLVRCLPSELIKTILHQDAWKKRWGTKCLTANKQRNRELFFGRLGVSVYLWNNMCGHTPDSAFRVRDRLNPARDQSIWTTPLRSCQQLDGVYMWTRDYKAHMHQQRVWYIHILTHTHMHLYACHMMTTGCMSVYIQGMCLRVCVESQVLCTYVVTTWFACCFLLQ